MLGMGKNGSRITGGTCNPCYRAPSTVDGRDVEAMSRKAFRRVSRLHV
jgi:hypothetical protein